MANDFEELRIRFPLGTRVRKRSGSMWRGRVVGYYSTALTPEGLAVESEHEQGSVQIYPAAALEKGEATDLLALKADCLHVGSVGELRRVTDELSNATPIVGALPGQSLREEGLRLHYITELAPGFPMTPCLLVRPATPTDEPYMLELAAKFRDMADALTPKFLPGGQLPNAPGKWLWRRGDEILLVDAERRKDGTIYTSHMAEDVRDDQYGITEDDFFAPLPKYIYPKGSDDDHRDQ